MVVSMVVFTLLQYGDVTGGRHTVIREMVSNGLEGIIIIKLQREDRVSNFLNFKMRLKRIETKNKQ
jgi:hypothetical protein